ncbi:coiled-coil domain-containing protein 3-like [Amblyraja radiata]|uniref:coiled-coil domain-containing protein 3-like n=1 Tax=Amblyraja radiata TaxID=386614 RepID=UPI001402187E|nr:coiled-coil domain-containing protein 3-like [Amblyraja radiata]
MGWVSALLLLTVIGEVWTCLQYGNKKRQSDLCRLELAKAIAYAKVVAIYKIDAPTMEVPSKETYTAELEPLCDVFMIPWFQWWMPGDRFNLTGLGDFDCHSYTVMENNTYFFSIRRDENHNLVPDGINDQDPIFPDTPENHKMFFSHFQFSNCVSGTNHQTYSPEWEAQEHNRFHCSNVQKALYVEEDRVRMLNQKVESLEKTINHLRERVKGTKRSLRQVK